MDQLLIQLFPIAINVIMSMFTYFSTVRLIPNVKDMFIKANLYGFDMNKTSKTKVPEALGVVCGCTFLVTMFLFIPMPFFNHFREGAKFNHKEFSELLVAILSICCMVFLGFADDVFDLKWRYKLLLPTIASLPLLMVYYISSNMTEITVPKPFRPLFGDFVDLWIFYYVYMGMLAVFCTNAINILAGVNGLEVGQSLIIAMSILVYNIVELSRDYLKSMTFSLELNDNLWRAHKFSMYFIIPYIATSLALLRHNWYPSRVFVGDTFCYFSGMTFAVVGIIGHFGKTTLLFFIPQILNFLYSVPQLFRLVPCPRHRLPKYDPETDQLNPSVTVFKKSELNILAKFVMWIFRTSKLVDWKEDDRGVVTCNNLTIINFVLLYAGPLREEALTTMLILIQVAGTLLAFVIRYPLASLFYDT
ncbi:UDP-N-acetylglucosamine--dolichyl-phosphate N-acetylglucosaminephosphotransferase [Copidosoma floridanum]|uniref:UDP-N-acetylglucosamine--dolichyl-phosphate N-acetylglucosaminephosphotransferase n=1 Tax=Copidosoma floridanum TaxID=29053 RepID=UPI0006C9DDD7|nr:UDP-N-acetylglucosamine--dolichyl-phosphate N-acetylglucosaminephosphotransferase [Copidosoma floridanum]